LVSLKDMEREQALSAERERIMRDMHDGVGGQLVQALSIATNRSELRPMEEPLRACLDELRLIIDSIEPTEGDLASVLGTLRARMSRRLSAAGVQIHWQVEDMPALTDFGPRRILQVSRIVQEIIANALQQRLAKSITVHAYAAPASVEGEKPQAVSIEFIDDGAELSTVDSQTSELHCWFRRAEEAGGCLTVLSSPAGVTMRLGLLLEVTSSKDRDVAQSPRSGLPLTYKTA
jgi:signal transduction histidine kinase